MRVQKVIEIDAPPERVWPFFVEPEKVLQWYSTFKRFEVTGPQRSGVGTRVYVEEQAAGPRMKMQFEVTQWDESEALALRMVAGPLKSYEQRWTLEPTDSGCRFRFAEEILFPWGAAGALLGRIAQPMSSRTVGKMQARLKALVEA